MKLRKRLSSWFGKRNSSPRPPIDIHKKVNIDKQGQNCNNAAYDYLIYLTRTRGEMAQQITHTRYLSLEVLQKLLPLLNKHCLGVLSAIEECNRIIKEANTDWERNQRKLN
jgi:hypothetical protein